MGWNFRTAVAAGLLAAAHVFAAEVPSVEQWRVLEIALAGEKTYPNPYADVTVTATFSGPGGRTIVREAFWCGGNRWKVRFAPVAVGGWQWRTACSDAADGGLHGRSGTLECAAYTGPLPLYRRGFLRVGDNRRHFCHADGTPFFWLGDTHWQMPDTERVDLCNHPEHAGGACPYGGQFQHVAADRAAKGFTVYQTYPHVENAHWWAARYTRIAPERFESVFDAQMNHLAERGFVIALGVGHFASSTRVPAEELRRWARYLVARYGAHPVVWITGQEINAPEERGQNRFAVWLGTAEEIALRDGYGHPHSGHQWVLDVATRPLGGEAWHDWFALQGGHRNSGLTPQERYAGYYRFTPTKPIVETEAMYERISCGPGGVADETDVRRSAWKALLCGCAGYTYGAGGVWALKWDAADTRWKSYNHPIGSWHEGMALPGSTQLQTLKRFFDGQPWTELEPRFGDASWAVWEDPERSVLATVGDALYLAYFYGETSKGTLKRFAPGKTYEARWTDPRTGTAYGEPLPVAPVGGAWQLPDKPDLLDWLLVVSSKRETERTQQ
jgi:hypothetical protein